MVMIKEDHTNDKRVMMQLGKTANLMTPVPKFIPPVSWEHKGLQRVDNNQ